MNKKQLKRFLIESSPGLAAFVCGSCRTVLLLWSRLEGSAERDRILIFNEEVCDWVSGAYTRSSEILLKTKKLDEEKRNNFKCF